MKHELFKRSAMSVLTVMAVIASIPSLAKEPTANFVENAGAKAQFDHSKTFVPLEQLPTVTSGEEGLATAQESDKLSAVAVSPDGRTYTSTVTAAEMELFSKAVRRWSGGSSGLGTGRADAERDSGGLEKGGAESVGAESVIGVDQRVRVFGTTTYPWRAVGRIAIGCTGTMIGPRHVLTAGHCVYNTGTNSWYSQLNVSPAQNGTSRPFGTIAWSRAISVLGWTRDHDRNYDYAMIVLSQPVGFQTGWLGYGYDNALPNYIVNINGYPGDKAFGTMWHSDCGLASIQTYRLYYSCDTAGGMSGSAAYVYFSSTSNRVIYGIHAYGVDGTGYNGATRIRQAVFNNLNAWKAANP